MYLCIDEGNTRTKAAIFLDNDKLVFSDTVTQQVLTDWLQNYCIVKSIVSSVLQASPSMAFLKSKNIPAELLTARRRLPFELLYDTPHTLGTDRIAVVAAAQAMFPHQNSLVFQAGTCLTADLITDGRTYRGGSISPGLDMRLKAMSHFTQKLPQVAARPLPNLPATNTADCLRAGAAYGMAFEIDGAINKYKQQYGPLNVILTGGDISFFESIIKETIFAVPHLVLTGLNALLT